MGGIGHLLSNDSLASRSASHTVLSYDMYLATPSRTIGYLEYFARKKDLDLFAHYQET